MASESIKVDKATFNKMHNHYKDNLVKTVPYSEFRAKVGSTTITGYTSGKVLFQGNDAQGELTKWQGSSSKTSTIKATSKSTTSTSLPENFANWAIIGSDEVGNGSYFGALTVCSVYLSPNQFELVELLGVKDSKLLKDSEIIKIAEELKLTVPYQLTICNPDKYNQAIEDGYNAVSIKVSLHNFTIAKLLNKMSQEQSQEMQGILIDQFTPANNYFKYLQKEKNPIKDKVYFVKKGESHHLAVASASIIARAAFLESLETLGKPFNKVLPSGAGKVSDVFAAQLIKRYGKNSLNETAKLHFKNTTKAIDLAKKLK
ncbi:ribonuclease HIII [Aerococcaceae bacterium DSM 111021]|nr:ribonuclease HIII [Aerococcaceae bacterium DSM 111021]